MENKPSSEVLSEVATTNCVEKLNDFLSTGKCSDALELVRKSVNEKTVKNTVWDIIPVVAKYLEKEITEKHPALYDCCVDILLEIAEKSQPEEALLEFMEQAECLENDLRFTAMLLPMQRCLTKMPKKRGNSLEWCFNTIHEYVIGLPIPDDCDLEGKEKKLVQAHPSYIRITNVYEAVIMFYKPFLQEIELKSNHKADGDAAELQRQNTICFLLQLLGKPLMFLDLEEDGAKSRARKIAEQVVSDLSKLCGDFFMFLNYAGQREMEDRSKYKEITPDDYYAESCSNDVYQRHDKLPTISIASFYYLLIGEQILIEHAPCVYNSLYIWLNTIYLATAIFKVCDVQNFVVRKGLILFQRVSSNFQDGAITHRTLDSSVHEKFTKSVCDIAIYAVTLETRKLSIECLRSYIFKFDMKGRYLLLSNMIVSIKHSSLVGYLTMQLKTIVGESLTTTPMSIFFSGSRLFGLLKPFIRLSNGAKTDLAEDRDQILASLNILFFLLSRDKKNVTEIWNHVADFESTLLTPLKEAIEVSRAHYKLRLKDLEDFKAMNGRKKAPELSSKISVSIAGGDAGCSDGDEANDMARVVNFGLNGFDLMESALALLTKCIESRQ